MKLTLKELAPYLPYGLKGQFYVHDVQVGAPYEVRVQTLTTDNIDFFLKYHTLHLRPLSDLVEVIEHNGEQFIPANILMKETVRRGIYKSKFAEGHNSYSYRIIQKPFGKILKISNHDDWVLMVSFSDMDRNKKYVVDLLTKWHFDVFGLIEKGLAIDINTIN